MSIVISVGFFAPAHSQNKGDEQGMELGQLDLRRDSVAMQEALGGWWRESMESLDERMEWYNEAKFGCFIHWGVYSVPAGIWDERRIGGYTEHLMRAARIPLERYKNELVRPFNPVEFDAEEWIQLAADAGMRYFIITAKHHDGFALYPSDAYPYDIRMTEFGRDPMRELRDAARKHGMKFGFYYSHAFDWEHPDAPGNDWDYDNPGGDKLLHGAQWWLNYPQFLPRAANYVDHKSIPQILELIDKYEPDILWFDTPHKLPLYENIRILHAIREADKDMGIVINGRLARSSAIQLGDYVNTGDRAAFFAPVEGYWESIPTTNESYGYSRVDFSHKPVSHFVRLLASAAAKGGNILMNVGPMGNGKWDETDIAIFRGVGDWLKMNGEAIYGAERTDLPVQHWGVATRKGDLLYLHVFDWPADGQLIVGGLQSEVERAWLIADPERKPLAAVRTGAHDLLFSLPAAAPDSVNTVIALQVRHFRKSYPVRLLTPSAENVLAAFDSRLSCRNMKFGDGKVSRNYVHDWTCDEQYMQWDLRLAESAAYDIYIDYNTDSANDAGVVTIRIAGNSYEVEYTPQSGWNRVSTIHAGRINLDRGEFTATLKGKEYTGGQYMRPIAIRLVPIKEVLF